MPLAHFSPRSVLALIASAVLGVGALSTTATAQSLWMARAGEQTLMLEALQPNMEGFDSKPLSGAFFLSGRGSVAPRLFVVGELPFARHKSTYLIFGPLDYSSSTIGNPYVGLELKLGSGPAFLEFGVRPPLADDTEFLASLTGQLADVTRWEAFSQRTFSILAAFNLREVTPSNIAFRLRVSPALALPTGNNNASEAKFYGIYSFQVGYEGTKARIGAGMSGRSQLTDEVEYSVLGTLGGEKLGERSSSEFGLHADFLSGPVRPGLDLHIPIAAMGEDVPLVVGASLTWTR